MEAQPNRRQSNAASLLVGKYVDKWRTNLSVRSSIGRSTSESLIQKQFLKNEQANILFGSKLSFDRFSWTGAQLEWIYKRSSSRNRDASIKHIENNYKLNWFVIPLDKHLLDVQLDYYTFRYFNNKHNYPFLDLMYRFSVEKRKLDFEVKWSNVLQNKTFSRLYFNSIEIVESNYRLRPSQVMFSAKFNFH